MSPSAAPPSAPRGTRTGTGGGGRAGGGGGGGGGRGPPWARAGARGRRGPASRSSPLRRSSRETRAARRRSSAATGLLRRSTAASSRASRAASSSLGAAAVIFGRVRVETGSDSLGEHGGRDDRRPQPLPVPDGGLGDVARDDDLVAHPPDVLALVVAGVGVEVDAQDGRQHGGGQ